MAAAGKPVDDAPFRYPGPRPQSRETGLLMLADACEATVRACKCQTEAEMDEVVRRTISERLEDHQLDECDLTLKDLDLIRRSFIETLRGVYHPRVDYATAGLAPDAAAPGAATSWSTTPGVLASGTESAAAAA